MAHMSFSAASDRLLRVAEVATIAGLSRATIWRLVARGTFPGPLRRVGGTAATRWRESDIAAWLDQQGAA